MANITVRKDGNQLAPSPRSEWDPLRVARELLRWDPFREMAPYMPSLDPISTFAPAFEVKETKDGFSFHADLPGVKEADVDVTRTGNRLTISGKREANTEEAADTYYAYERSYGSFARSFTLPDGVDAEHIHAELKDGVLALFVPKKPEAQPTRIALKSPQKQQS